MQKDHREEPAKEGGGVAVVYRAFEAIRLNIS
jgi:hypothetical protein